MNEAFCPLLFAANGGKFDELGRPYIPSDTEWVRGKCTQSFDCGQCPYLSQWITGRVNEGWQIEWLCVHCIKEEVPAGIKADPSRWRTPGFYQSSSRREWEDEIVDSKISLEGCTRCAYGSAFLQLVLRR